VAAGRTSGLDRYGAAHRRLGGLVTFPLSMVLSKLMLFFVGGAVGAVAGTKLFVLPVGKDASVLLAVILIPTIAFLFAFLAQRWGESSWHGPRVSMAPR
jgi:hypothetical protein